MNCESLLVEIMKKEGPRSEQGGRVLYSAGWKADQSQKGSLWAMERVECGALWISWLGENLTAYEACVFAGLLKNVETFFFHC